MENQKKKLELNYLESMVEQKGVEGTAERLSIHIADLFKVAGRTTEADDVINLLMYLKKDVLRGRFTV